MQIRLISSVFLLGWASLSAGQACIWTGTWDTTYGQLKMTQSGLSVYGNYTWDDGLIHGTLDGAVLRGTWHEAPSYEGASDSGNMEFVIDEGCESFDGNWNYASSAPGDWTAYWGGALVSGPVSHSVVFRSGGDNTTINGRPAPENTVTEITDPSDISATDARRIAYLECARTQNADLIAALSLVQITPFNADDRALPVLAGVPVEPPGWYDLSMALFQSLAQRCSEAVRGAFSDLTITVGGGALGFQLADTVRLKAATDHADVFAPAGGRLEVIAGKDWSVFSAVRGVLTLTADNSDSVDIEPGMHAIVDSSGAIEVQTTTLFRSGFEQ